MAVGAPNMDQFELYFKRADLDQDGRISGAEAVTFFQASGLPKPVLAQIWTHADQNRAGSLGRSEFYNALKLITVAQRKLDLTSDTVKAALYGPASAKIPAPQMNLGALPVPQSNLNMGLPAPATSHNMGIRGPQGYLPQQNQVIRPPRPPLANTTMQPQHGLTASAQPSPQASTSLMQNVASRPNGTAFAANSAAATGGPIAANGFASSSAFGDNKPIQLFQSNVAQQPTVGQNQQMQSTLKHTQQVPLPNSSTVPVRSENVPSSQSPQPWPQMTQSNVQKYTKVFMEVDTDRDGKITGEQARNLFLSWRLPREILKQVWDLSDQDNDSMLSLNEFCIALYLMERYREGRPLPRVLPAGVIFEGTPLPQQSGQGPAPLWRPPPGVQQAHGNTGQRQVPAAAAAARPPRSVPVPIPQDDEEVQPRQHKPRVPVLEKHLVDQLSTEEQNSLNSKFQEATEADNKVVELEKEISEAKQQIEYYRSKMQEIVLYKSRCDTRLNEITERVSADKREVESLSKKYEDKYKQSGDVASKLTIEEATFRDIQDKKMELYRAIVKLDQDGKPDDIQVHVDRIQADLEEQVKALNERCKMYGLRAKPTSLVELPFGWQRGIQEGAADWDEQWDKFEDEGFTYVKELTLDVQNVIAPPKPKSSPLENDSTSRDEATPKVSSSDANGESEKLSMAEDIASDDESNEPKNDSAAKSPPDSPASRKAADSDHAVKTQSEPSAEPVFSGDQKFDEPGWGTFDSHYDSDAASDLNSAKPKDTDQESHHENSFFDSDGWGLNPIRTEVPKKNTIMFDSVPGTPAYSYAGSPPGDNLFQNRGPFASAFADSVPSTPAYSYAGSDFQRPFASAFADSVPSTPMFASNSPRRFNNEGPEDHSFNNNFARFDSFSSNTPRDSFSRFDSFRSTAQDSDSDFGHSLFQSRESFSRFDSMKSTSEFNRGFASFDDEDPFGLHDPFKTSVESETPRRDSVDSWRAF